MIEETRAFVNSVMEMEVEVFNSEYLTVTHRTLMYQYPRLVDSRLSEPEKMAQIAELRAQAVETLSQLIEANRPKTTP